MAKSIRRRLSAIFFSDMKGFSRSMDEDEDATLELLREHNRILDAQVALHNGRVVKTIGDAYMVEFGSSVDAVACALDCQRAIEAHNETSERLIEIRIGVHAGEIVVEGDDVFGEAVNIAARLEPQAPVGGVCISEVVYKQVRKRVHATGVSMGTVTLKGISEAMPLYAIVPGSEHLQIAGMPRSRVVTTTQAGAWWTPGRGLGAALLVGAVTVVLLWPRGEPGLTTEASLTEAVQGAVQDPREAAAEGPQRGGVLRMAGGYPISGTWDVYPDHAAHHQHLVDAVVERLSYDDTDGEIVSGALDRWTLSEDQRSGTLVLRPDVHFHRHPCMANGEGRPATAADVAWSLRQAREHGAVRYTLDADAPQGGLLISDPRTLQISLGAPWPYMERELAQVRLLPRELQGCEDVRAMKRLVGSGAFYLDEVTAGGRVVLKLHESYGRRDEEGRALPFLEGVEWVPITDFTRLIHTLHEGDLQISIAPEAILETYWDDPYSPQPQLKEPYKDLRVRSGRVLLWENELEIFTLEPVLREGGGLNSRELRRALAHAVDRNALPLEENALVPHRRLLDAKISQTRAPLAAPLHDKEQGLAAVKRARATLGHEIPQLLLGTQKAYRSIADRVVQQAKEVGLQLRVVTWSGNTDANPTTVDVVLRYRNWPRHGAEVCGLPLWVARGGEEQPGANASPAATLARQILTEVDPRARGDLYTQLEKLLVEEAYLIPIGRNAPLAVEYRVLYSPRLQDVFDPMTGALVPRTGSNYAHWWMLTESD
jgi:class 3 adenylate cyclase/ABC-type transport system substrate-binding protein